MSQRGSSPQYGRVESVERLTPALIRVVLGGDGLAGFATPEGADAYVNVAVPPPGAPYGPIFDAAAVCEEHDKDWWPARRRYTVRSWDAGRRLLTMDFVVHGDTGAAGPWAARAQVGDVLVLDGPAGGYRPDETADWHLLVGDESALPAIAACLEAVAPGRRVVALLVCDGPDHEIPLPTPGDLDLRWLHRPGSSDPAGLLLAALEDLDFPAGRVDAFVHGEADEIRGIRRHLLAERGLARAAMSCSPYWRRTMSDEDWRRVKADFVAAMESDVA